jgi:hypothetical protein
MARPDDLKATQETRQAQAPLKRIIWFGFGLLMTEGIVLGVYSSLPNVHLTEIPMLVIVVGTVTVVGWFTTLAKRTSADLRTKDVLRLSREDFDKNYRKFLFYMPIYLGLISLAVGFRWTTFLVDPHHRPTDVVAGWAGITGFISLWMLCFTLFAGNGRKGVEDEMVLAHRNQAYGAGFVASAFSGFTLAILMIFAPKAGLPAVPPLLTLPLIVAMVRLGLLERAAAVDG